jgi:ferredoxin
VRVEVDTDRCRGHGVCLALCPEVFGLADAGHAEILVDEVPTAHHDQVRTAVAQCPEQALRIVAVDA